MKKTSLSLRWSVDEPEDLNSSQITSFNISRQNILFHWEQSTRPIEAVKSPTYSTENQTMTSNNEGSTMGSGQKLI